jgi:spore coat protein U-like protein
MANNRRLLTFAIAIATVGTAVALLPSTATAQVSAQFNVVARVVPRCTVSAVDLDFGDYDPLLTHVSGTPLDGQTDYTIRCTPGATATISLSVPAGGRVMAGPDAAGLTYDLYTTAARDVVWDTTNTVTWVAPNASPFTGNIFGRIPGGQDRAVGNYSQQITMTVNY